MPNPVYIYMYPVCVDPVTGYMGCVVTAVSSLQSLSCLTSPRCSPLSHLTTMRLSAVMEAMLAVL